ncbi:MAG: DUF1365 domain-containing protein [Bdellovibrionales bacterium]|nr:DUF1365 domain-containing protein [Bdellovibrionales bacterium]
MSISIYSSKVVHQRNIPKKHSFEYNLDFFGFLLEGTEEDINDMLLQSKLNVKFRRKDYFGDPNLPLQESVLKTASQFYNTEINGSVFFLGQLNQFGFYFSPVNFYIISNKSTKKPSHLLAEVTNTPWGEKHCYLVDLNKELKIKKEFHVSPFNHMNLIYEWTIKIEDQKLFIKIDCISQVSEFFAYVDALRSPNKKNVNPMNCLKILMGIYFQAILLFFKRTPIYAHPKTKELS